MYNKCIHLFNKNWLNYFYIKVYLDYLDNYFIIEYFHSIPTLHFWLIKDYILKQ